MRVGRRIEQAGRRMCGTRRSRRTGRRRRAGRRAGRRRSGAPRTNGRARSESTTGKGPFEARGDKLARQLGRIPRPEREERLIPTRQLLFPIGADVLEEEVAEGDGADLREAPSRRRRPAALPRPRSCTCERDQDLDERRCPTPRPDAPAASPADAVMLTRSKPPRTW